MIKKSKIRLILFIGLLFTSAYSKAFDTLILSYVDFIKQVEENHPIAKQAILFEKETIYIKNQARGELDPILTANQYQKFFKGSNYFSISNAELNIPLWPGIDIMTGYDYTVGTRLNDENSLPPNGLLFAGIKFSLAQGIVTDKRRTAVALSKVYSDMNLNERKMILNGLFADAYVAYAEWVFAYIFREIYQEAVDLSLNRLNFIRSMQKSGERAAVDTLEAYIQYRTRSIQLMQANVEYVNTQKNLETFLWDSELNPLSLNFNINPDTTFLNNRIVEYNTDNLEKRIRSIDVENPQLNLYSLKRSSLKLDYLYKKDLLKPKISGVYKFISEPINTTLFAPNVNDYVWGINFSYPIFSRKQRADLGINKIKQQENQLLFQFKKTEIINKLRAVHNELNMLVKQTTEMQNVYGFYSKLYDAEKTKFSIGETSVFMLNTRETQVIESKIKWYELMAKYAKKQALYNYLSGEDTK